MAFQEAQTTIVVFLYSTILLDSGNKDTAMEITATLSAKHADKLARLEAHFGMSRDALLEYMLDRIYDVNAVDIGYFHWGEPKKVTRGMRSCSLCKQPLTVGQRYCEAEAHDPYGYWISAHEECITGR